MIRQGRPEIRLAGDLGELPVGLDGPAETFEAKDLRVPRRGLDRLEEANRCFEGRVRFESTTSPVPPRDSIVVKRSFILVAVHRMEITAPWCSPAGGLHSDRHMRPPKAGRRCERDHGSVRIRRGPWAS